MDVKVVEMDAKMLEMDAEVAESVYSCEKFEKEYALLQENGLKDSELRHAYEQKLASPPLLIHLCGYSGKILKKYNATIKQAQFFDSQ